MLKLKIIDLFYFHLFFIFYLGLWVSVISHDMTLCHTFGHISQSHNHMLQKNIEGSEIIILFYISMTYNIHGL